MTWRVNSSREKPQFQIPESTSKIKEKGMEILAFPPFFLSLQQRFQSPACNIPHSITNGVTGPSCARVGATHHPYGQRDIKQFGDPFAPSFLPFPPLQTLVCFFKLSKEAVGIGKVNLGKARNYPSWFGMNGEHASWRRLVLREAQSIPPGKEARQKATPAKPWPLSEYQQRLWWDNWVSSR